MADVGEFDVNVNLGIDPVDEGILSSEEDSNALISYLTDETESVLGGDERGQLEKKWQKWRRISEGRPEQETKDYPWAGASNVTVPITMSATHGIFALLKNIFGNRDEFWQINSSKANSEQARVLSTVLNLMAESRDHLNLRQANNTIFYDLARMGTQFVKIPWITDAVSFKRRTLGGGVENATRVRRNSPVAIPIRMENFLTRPYWYDIQRAPWIGHRIFMMDHELQQRAQQGIYSPEAVETILAAGSAALDDQQLESLRRQGINVTSTDLQMKVIIEAYIFWDVDGDGVAEDMIVWFHPDTGTILRTEYNELGIRPYVRIPFINLPYQLYGLGTGWISEPMQDEIDALHNMRVDATHISMLQMYIRKRGSGSMQAEEYRPLKEILVDNPAEDFIPVKFPPPGGESLQAELIAKEYNDRANQIPDSQMGFENRTIGTRATASGTMFLSQQNDKVSSALVENVEESYGDLGQIVAFQLIRNKEAAKISILPLLNPADQEIFSQILELNVEDIPTVFSFQVSTTDEEDTKAIRLQHSVALAELYGMYGEKMIQLAGLMENPQVPPKMKELAGEFFVGSTKLMEKIFTDLNERDASSYLPYYKDLELMQQMMDQMKEAQVGQVKSATRQRGNVPDVGRAPTAAGAIQEPNVGGAAGEGVPSEDGGGSEPSQGEF
jgi:hypothetical protein